MPDLVTDGDNLGDHLATRSFKTIKGSDIASATNITIGTSGNTFDVTGTTTIEHFDNANWAVGSVVSLHFDGAVILTNNAGGLTGAQANILLSGDANFTTATGDILTFLLHDSTNWQEVSRNSVASIPDGSITNAKLDTGIDAVKLADGSVTNSELKYINTLSDNAQSQLDLKSPLASPTFTGTVVLPNVPAIVTTQLNLKAPLASPTFTGDVTLPTAGKLILNPDATYPNQMFTRDTSTYQYYVSMVAGGSTLMELNGSNNYIWIKPDTRLTFGGDQGKSTEGSIQYKTSTNQIEFRSPDDTPRMNLTTTGVDVLGTLNLSGNNLDNIKNLHHNISTSAGTGMNFADDQLQTLSRNTTTTFNGSNYATGKSKTLRLINTSGSTITLGFDSSWKFVGAKPTDLAGSKTAILTLTCFGSTASDVVAGYAVEE